MDMVEDDMPNPNRSDTDEKTALLVDDSPLDQIKFEEMLQRLGFKVLVAPNGNIALNMLEETKPDLIVLDVIMPQKGGIQTLQEIRAIVEFRHVPIVMLTNKDYVRIIRAVIKEGPTDYLLKSSPPEKIEDRLKRYL